MMCSCQAVDAILKTRIVSVLTGRHRGSQEDRGQVIEFLAGVLSHLDLSSGSRDRDGLLEVTTRALAEMAGVSQL